MELLLITKTKLKIVMTSEDMEKYSITGDTSDINEADWKQTLQGVLEKAKTEVGFDASGRGITVQMFPSKDGGCEMYITKNRSSLPVPIHSKTKQTNSVFSFSCLQDLLDACVHLEEECMIVQSSAYADGGKSTYYLVLCTVERDIFGKNPCLTSVANEYGKMIKGDWLPWYLKEHCVCLCERDAINTLAALA